MKAGTHLLALIAVLGVGALCAPVARAGSYDVVSCSVDGAFLANNAWAPANNPGDNPTYQTDTSCSKPGDPIAVSLAPNTAYGNGTWAALRLSAPAQTTITNYKLSIRHYWFAPPLPNYPTERTYSLAKLGEVIFSGAGLFAQVDQDALSGEGHWYGYRGAHQSGFADTGVFTVSRANSDRALAAPSTGSMTLAAGCFTDDGSGCSLGTMAPGT